MSELTPQLQLGVARSFPLPGDEIANEMRSIGFLAAEAGGDRSNPALTVLKSKIGLWCASEEAAARGLLGSVLGAPELALDGAGKSRIGWDLTRSDVQQAFRARKLLQSVTVRSDRPTVSLIYGFGDLCADFAGAIVDLDEGNSGCGGPN